jgi:hypothetical protein
VPRPSMTREQIIKAIQRTAAKLGRTPNRVELEIKGKVSRAKVDTHFPSFQEAIREAGLEPRVRVKNVDTWALLKDWARVVRRYRRIPTFTEYRRHGKHCVSTLAARCGRWVKVAAYFKQHVERTGRQEEFADVLEMAKRCLIPAAVNGAPHRRRKLKTRLDLEMCAAAPMANARQLMAAESPAPAVLPPELQGKKCVTGNMLAILFAIARERRTSSGAVSNEFLAIQSFPDRPMMGAPMNLGPLATEPVNEMGVMCLFVLLAERLGFVIDVIRSQYPDCEARVKVDPGRWQRIWIEFEFESISFRNHKHNPEGCDIIVCWRHNWLGCPKKLVVVELSRVVGSLGHLGIGSTGEFHRGGAETRREIAAAENLTADDADNNDLRRSGNA